MAAKVVELDYEPREPFKPFHERNKRFSVLVCHRRAGKTVATIYDLVVRALNTAKAQAQYGYVCPTFSQAKKVAWKYLKAAVAPIPGVKANESECSVLLPNGSQITLYGADNPDALRGLYFDGIVLDEFGDMKGRVYSEVVRPAIADRFGWVVFIGTPRGKNAFYEKREQARLNKSGKWFYLELKASESGILKQSEIDDMKEEMDEDEIAAELECSFDAAIKGSYYGKWLNRIEEAGHFTHVPLVPGRPVDTAWDLGRTDTTAIWFYQIYGGQVRVIDHYETSQMDIEEIYDEVIDLGYDLGKVWLPHDAKAKTIGAKKSVIEFLLDKGLDCQIVPDEKIRDGINATRRMIPFCYFDLEKCYTGIEHLKSYQRTWDPDRQVFANTPLHDVHSHSADAFRYLSLAVRETDIEQSLKKAQKPLGPAEAKQEWERKRAVNTARTIHSFTLDDLWEANNYKPTYVRI